MSAIQIEQLSKSYNDELVLNQLNLVVKQGEVYGFVGINGAGKTTTINLIMSMIHKDSGTIRILGEEVSFTDQHYKAKIGYVPDVPMFPKHMNAYEYLQYTLELFGYPKNNEKVLETLDFVSLERSNKRIHTFSRGMKQRLAIAQALVHDPDILIMDEPTSALDPVGRKDVMDIISKLKGKKTIFYSTHILDDVEKVCDRIGILHHGKLIVEDSIENMKAQFVSNRYQLRFGEQIDTKTLDHSILKVMDTFNHSVVVELMDGKTTKDLLSLLIQLDTDVLEVKQLTKSIEEIFIEEIS